MPAREIGFLAQVDQGDFSRASRAWRMAGALVVRILVSVVMVFAIDPTGWAERCWHSPRRSAWPCHRGHKSRARPRRCCRHRREWKWTGHRCGHCRRGGCRRCGAQRLDFARPQELRRAIGLEAAIALAHEALGRFRPAQHADQAPHAVIVDRRALAGRPDERDHAEPLAAVAVEQVLLIAIGMGNGESRRQPIVLRDQPRQQLGPGFQDFRLVARGADEFGQAGDEATQARDARAWNSSGRRNGWGNGQGASVAMASDSGRVGKGMT
jgi:hypothetical protein